MGRERTKARDFYLPFVQHSFMIKGRQGALVAMNGTPGNAFYL